MNKTSCCLLLCSLSFVAGTAGAAQSMFHEAKRIELKGVEGRIDHMAIDLSSNRLFVAALGNNTIEVVDLQASRVIKSVSGLKEPQGLLVVPGTRQLIATNGESTSAQIYDKDSLELLKEIPVREDGDNIRYDAVSKRIYIGCGAGREGALAALDPEGDAPVGQAPLSGHPESFQLERKGSRIFVNVPTANKVEVVDRESGKAVDSWPIAEHDNFPMALDEAHARLFIGTRNPAKLLVLDTRSGRRVAALDSVKDADDIFYDAAAKRIYVSGGEGFVSVIEQADPDQYRLVEKLPTREGARTSLFVPEASTLFVALPKRGDKSAEIRVYEKSRSQ
jgi:DNA-binding beta-propeller fold protein YncE